MKSRYVFAGIVTIVLVLVSITLLQVVSGNDPPAVPTKSWDGGGDGINWESAANWSPDGVPGAADKVYIDSGTGVTISSAQSVTWLHSHQPITISGGTLTLAEDSLIANAFTLSGTLTGTGNLAISGLFTWSGGTMSGAGATTVASGGVMNVSGSNKVLQERTLNNYGTVNWAGNPNYLNIGPVINNYSGGIFNLQADMPFAGGGSSPTFNNLAGATFNKDSTVATATVSAIFNSSGTVNVTSGTLNLGNGGAGTGAYDVSAGATLGFIGGTYNLNAGSSAGGLGTLAVTGGPVNVAEGFTAAGTISLLNATVNFNGNANSNNVNLAGTISGPGTLTVSGTLNWSGGTMSGTGATTIASGGVMNVSGSFKVLDQRTLNNYGTVNWAGNPNYLNTGPVINNYSGGTFNLQADMPFAGGGSSPIFNNLANATFNKDGTVATATVSATFYNSGSVNATSGTLNLYGYTQTAGVTRLNGGALTSSLPLNIQGGALSGIGTATADVTTASGAGTGQVSPGLSPGILNITGSYIQGAAGAVSIELGGTTPGNGASNYDQLNISGASTLAGTLNVSLTGGFTPAIGNTFTIMTFASHSGTFTTANLPALGGGRAWDTVAYNSGSVVLSVVASSNNPPTAANDAYSTNEDTALNQAAPGVLANDTDSDDDALTAIKVANPSHGTVTLNSNGSFTYTPTTNYNGSDSFTYRAYDGTDYSSTVTVTITVNAVNDAPGFTKGPDQTVQEDTGLQTVNGWATGLSVGPSNESGQVLDFIVSNSNNSLFSVQPAIAANGTLTYTPAANANGSATVTVSIHDNGGASNGGVDTSGTQTFTVTVTSVNDPPVAADDATYSTDENAVLNQAAPGVLGNDTDIDGNPLTAILVSNVSHGTLVLNADGSFTYTPAAGFTGSDSFTCKANDGTADSNVVTVTITVNQLPPSVTSLDHLEATPGETIRVVITGTNLGGATAVEFGPGVTVEALAIDSASQITVDVKVASDAQSGLRDVSVTTPQGVATLTDAFTVGKAPSEGTPVWIWPVAALAVIAAGAGGFFLFFLLPRRKAKPS